MRVRLNDTCIFFDTSGRAYSLPARSLPSARGQGEPLTGRLNPPEGARFVGIAAGTRADVLLASDAGYGFVGSLGDMTTKNRAGKSVLNVPKGGVALVPVVVERDTHVAAVTNQGRMLVFELSEVPVLSRGKGNKLLNVPSASFKTREEFLVALVTFTTDDRLVIRAGQRHLNLRFKDLDNYLGERARRGRKLPRGFQKVDSMEVDRD